MMFTQTKEYPLQKTLMKQNQWKCRMRSGRECSRLTRNHSHLIWHLYQMLIKGGIWGSYILAGVKDSVILPVRRVNFNVDNGNWEDNKAQKYPVAGLLHKKLIKGQSAPQVDLEPFDGNPLEYRYFMSTFRESFKKKIEDSKDRLTQLIQYTREEAKDLIKNFINYRPEYG